MCCHVGGAALSAHARVGRLWFEAASEAKGRQGVSPTRSTYLSVRRASRASWLAKTTRLVVVEAHRLGLGAAINGAARRDDRAHDLLVAAALLTSQRGVWRRIL